jgi:hypothetical protein
MAIGPTVMTHSRHLLGLSAMALASTPQRARLSARLCLVTTGAQALALVANLSHLLPHTPRHIATRSAKARIQPSRRVLFAFKSMFQTAPAVGSLATPPSRPRMRKLSILHPAVFLLPSQFTPTTFPVLGTDLLTVSSKLKMKKLWRWLLHKSSVNLAQSSSRSAEMESICPSPSANTL